MENLLAAIDIYLIIFLVTIVGLVLASVLFFVIQYGLELLRAYPEIVVFLLFVLASGLAIVGLIIKAVAYVF